MRTRTFIILRLSSLFVLIAMYKTVIPFLVFILLLMLSGCCINRETFFLPEKVKEYIYFKTGSYWIYQDQNGRIDTLRVDNSKISMGRAGRESCDESEYLNMDYFSTFLNKNLYSTGSGAVLEPSFCLGGTIPWIWSDLTVYSQEYLQDTLELNGYSFYEVYICEFPDPESVSSYNMPFRYFLAKNIGIIIKEYADGSVFSVVEYHVEK